MDEAVDEAIEAHCAMKLARFNRDRAIRRAKDGGATAYAIAKRFRLELGEKEGLTAERVRQIVEAGLGQRER